MDIGARNFKFFEGRLHPKAKTFYKVFLLLVTSIEDAPINLVLSAGSEFYKGMVGQFYTSKM